MFSPCSVPHRQTQDLVLHGQENTRGPAWLLCWTLLRIARPEISAPADQIQIGWMIWSGNPNKRSARRGFRNPTLKMDAPAIRRISSFWMRHSFTSARSFQVHFSAAERLELWDRLNIGCQSAATHTIGDPRGCTNHYESVANYVRLAASSFRSPKSKQDPTGLAKWAEPARLGMTGLVRA